MPRRRSSLRRWRDLIDGGEVEIDWRARLHPSARPQISTSASSAAKESVVERDLTDATAADSARDGRANRRSFTSEEKLAIVLECEQPGNSVSAVARAHRLATSALFRWRAEFGYGRKMKAELAPVVLSNEQSTDKTKPAACRSAATAGFTAHRHNVYTLAARDHGRRSDQNPRTKR